jgi:hypothetical protein
MKGQPKLAIDYFGQQSTWFEEQYNHRDVMEKQPP